MSLYISVKNLFLLVLPGALNLRLIYMRIYSWKFYIVSFLTLFLQIPSTGQASTTTEIQSTALNAMGFASQEGFCFTELGRLSITTPRPDG